MDLLVIEGDGIGREVVPAALRVLQAVIQPLNVHRADAGWDYFTTHQTPISDDTVQLAREIGAVLFGAATSPPYVVEGYYSPIVHLRRSLQTHANIRPTRFLPVPTAREGVDLVVVRENTEDVYINQEYTAMTGINDGEVGTAQKVITRSATERIAHTAFQLARLSQRELITVVHKGNVLPHTDGLFRRVALEIAEEYPDIEVDELLIDTAAYWMVKEPTRFDMILTTNQYGDILSDMAAAWGGGLGFVPALNLGEGIAIAEPVHGSAPDVAGHGIGNPTALILSTALLARYHWQLPDIADHIEHAVRDTLRAGFYTPDVKPNGSVNTQQFTDEVIQRLQ